MKLGIGKRKLNRVNISLSNQDYIKLKRLSIACDLRHTTMADLLVQYCLNNGHIIHEFQKKYNKHDEYRVRPIRDVDGTTTYLQG